MAGKNIKKAGHSNEYKMIEISSYASGSSGNLYSIYDGKTKLLIECGLPIMGIKKHLNFKLSEISACLLSHEHLDHAQSAQQIMDVGLDLYCSQATAAALNLSSHRLHIIQTLKQFKIGTWTVLPLDGIHNISVLGFLIMNKQGERLLFLIDTAYCKYRFKNLNYIMIGINYCKDILKKNIKDGRLNPALGRRIMQSHLSLSTALEFFKAQDLSQVQEIHILHCSEMNADKNRIKEAVQRQTAKLVIV